MPVNVSSFDVFDTCLLRRSAAPSMVFEEIGKRLQKEGRLPSGDHAIQDFLAARIRSEAKALAKDTSNEPSLTAIWLELATEMGWDASIELHRLELEQEDLELFANPEMLEIVRDARLRSARVLFLSDMYLPSTFIREQLVKHGFFEDGDRLYVSCEHRCNKRSSGLYRLVLNAENLKPEELTHCGDHAESDWKVPKLMGINAVHYRNAEYTRTERAMAGVGGIAAATASRTYRLRRPQAQTDVKPLVSGFSGPFVSLFANWVLAEAHQNGIERLYFFSRDCQSVWKAACLLAPEHGSIDCRYLKVSRQSLLLPSAKAATPEEMPWMFRDFEEPKLGKLLGKLDLDPDEWHDHFNKLHGGAGRDFIVSTQSDRKMFWRLLNQSPMTVALQEIRSIRNSSAVGYLKQNGLFDDTKIGVVDLGWFASCQAALSTILKSAGRESPIHGFYLGLHRDRKGSAYTGPVSAMFYGSPHDRRNVADEKVIFNRATILEHLVGVADHPSIHHYEAAPAGGDVYVACGRSSLSHPDEDFPGEYHREILTFTQDFLVSGGCTMSVHQTKGALLVAASDFWQHPPLDALKVVAKIPTSVYQDNSQPVPLAGSFGLMDVIALVTTRWKFMRRFWRPERWAWTEASLALSPRFIQALAIVSKLPKTLKSTLS